MVEGVIGVASPDSGSNELGLECCPHPGMRGIDEEETQSSGHILSQCGISLARDYSPDHIVGIPEPPRTIEPQLVVGVVGVGDLCTDDGVKHSSGLS